MYILHEKQILKQMLSYCLFFFYLVIMVLFAGSCSHIIKVPPTPEQMQADLEKIRTLDQHKNTIVGQTRLNSINDIWYTPCGYGAKPCFGNIRIYTAQEAGSVYYFLHFIAENRDYNVLLDFDEKGILIKKEIYMEHIKLE